MMTATARLILALAEVALCSLLGLWIDYWACGLTEVMFVTDPIYLLCIVWSGILAAL